MRSESRARPADSTLMATSRFNRASRARQTSPMPPRPSSSTISKLPQLRARAQRFDRRKRGTFQEEIGLLVQEGLHFAAELRIVRTGLQEECGALLRRLR